MRRRFIWIVLWLPLLLVGASGQVLCQTPSDKPPARGIDFYEHAYCGDLLVEQTETPLTTVNVGKKSVPVLQFEGGVPKDYYSDSIYLHWSNKAKPEDLTRLVEVNERFLSTLGPGPLDDSALKDARFLTTAKRGADEFVTLYEIKNGKFGAFSVRLNIPSSSCKKKDCTNAEVFNDIIVPWLEPISGKGRLYVVGDDLTQLDPTALAKRFNCDVIRRSDRITTSLQETERRLAQLDERVLDRAHVTFVNGLPQSMEAAVASGYQRNEYRGLTQMSLRFDVIASRFLNPIQVPMLDRPTHRSIGAESFRDLLTEGESDVVLIVAHSDGERIFLNGKQISIEDISNYPDRVTPSPRPRVCILMSCQAANFNQQSGWWVFKRNVESLSEILVRKGYFDKVVAPRTDIAPVQALEVLQGYLRGKPIRDVAAQWLPSLVQVAETPGAQRAGHTARETLSGGR